MMARGVVTIGDDVDPREAVFPKHRFLGHHLRVQDFDRRLAAAERAVDRHRPATSLEEAGHRRLRRQFVADHDVRGEVPARLIGEFSRADDDLHVPVVDGAGEDHRRGSARKIHGGMEGLQFALRVDLELATGVELNGGSLVESPAEKWLHPRRQHLVDRQPVEMEQRVDGHAAVVMGVRLAGGPAQRMILPEHRPADRNEPVVRGVQRLVAGRRAGEQRREDLLDDQPAGRHAPENDRQWSEPRSLHHQAFACDCCGRASSPNTSVV